MIIDRFYQQHHRRLRERFGLERVVRHKAQIQRALEKRKHEQALMLADVVDLRVP